MIHYINIANNADAEYSMQNKILVSNTVFVQNKLRCLVLSISIPIQFAILYPD